MTRPVAVWLAVLVLAAGCRTVPLAPLPSAEFGRFEMGSHRRLGRWTGAPLAEHQYLAPSDPDVDPKVLVRSLQGRGVRALSLAGVSWGGSARLQLLAPLELEWLDLSSSTLQRGALKALRVPRLVLEYSNLDDALLQELPGAVQELQLRGARVTDASVPWLDAHPELRALGVASTRLLASGVAALTLKGLVELDLGSLPIDDDSLVILEGLGALEVLCLEGTQISDAGLAHLRGLARLTSLNLSQTNITDAGLSGLEKAAGLTELLLGGTAVGAPTVARLGALTGLKVLELSGTQVGVDVTRTLAHLTGLVALSLASTPQTTASIARLAPLKALRELDLEKTEVDGEVVEVLAPFTALESLDLSDAALGEAPLEHLPASLRVLRLRGTGVRVARLAPLLGHLEGLDVSGLAFTDDDALAVAGQATGLELLKANYTALGDRGLRALAALPELARLEAGKTLVTDLGVAALGRSRSLRTLELGLCAIGDAALLALEHSPLSTLRLASTGVTDLGVQHLPASLSMLGLFGTKLTQRAVDALLRLPGLRQVDLRQVPVELAPLRARGIDVLE